MGELTDSRPINGQSEFSLDVSAFKPGIYYLKVEDGKGQVLVIDN